MNAGIVAGSISVAGSPTPFLARGETSPDVPDALLFHGLGGSARHWRDVMERLPGDRRWIAVDLPGHGDNPLSAACSAARMEAWTEALLGALCDGRPCAIVGHSLGGLVVLRLAITCPERVAWLAMVASAGRIDVHPDLREQLETGVVRRDFLTRCLTEPADPATESLVAGDFDRMRLGAGSIDVWGTAGLDLRAAAASVGAPCLVIGAGADVVVSPRKSRELSRLLPAARLVMLEGRGHYVHLEDPDRVARELSRFAASPSAESDH